MDALMRHSWPGNVRELIHTLEQVVALCDDVVVGFDDLPASVRGTPESPAHAATGETATLRDLYRRHILSVLERTGGNRAQAARLLGTSERTFYRLLKRYGETLPASDPAKAVPPQKPEA
jgi:transcriptional regulator of acetoin/glycerol metabolism